MIKVVGIRFRNAGKIYYFDPKDFEMEIGSHAIVETARGIEYGTVLIAPREVADDQVIQPLKPVIRVATEEDTKTVERNREREKSAYKTCQEKIEKHGLEMKLVQAEYTFDNNKLLFYKATADVNGLVFKEEVYEIKIQVNTGSYHGIELILEGLEKAKMRLDANVNFELVIELLLMTLKEN